MASIVKRGKTYSVVYYEGEGSNRHQVWESGLSYSAAKSRKATIEYEKEQNTHVDHNDITVSEFLYEFIEKYGEKKWVASTYDGNVGLLENYVHPYWGDKKLRSIRTKTVDDFYHFLLNEAEPQPIWANQSGSISAPQPFMTSTRFCDVLSIRRKNGSTLQKIRFWMRHCRSTRKLNGMH